MTVPLSLLFVNDLQKSLNSVLPKYEILIAYIRKRREHKSKMVEDSFLAYANESAQDV